MTSWTVACQAPLSMGFSSKNIGVGCHFLLQSQPMDWTRLSYIVGIFFTASATEELFLTLFSFNTCPAAAAAKSLQSCPTLCDPIDGSPPGSPVPGTIQARTLEWVAISFSNAQNWNVKVKSLSRVRLFPTPWTAAYQAPPSMGFFQARVLECVAIAFSNIGWNSPNWCL